MNRFKIILIFLILIIIAAFAGCGNKEKTSETGMANDQKSLQAESSVPESTGAALEVKDSGSDSGRNTPQSITVISKSDSTITQVEKKKVLDDLSAEVDSLINEVNNDNSSEGKLE